MIALSYAEKYYNMSSRFGTISERDRQTDRQTEPTIISMKRVIAVLTRDKNDIRVRMRNKLFYCYFICSKSVADPEILVRESR